MTRPALSLLLPVALLTLAGCPSAKDDSDGTADTDTDTDPGTDTDADSPFSGSLTVTSTRNGEPLCDADVTLTGTPYTGDCEGCDFAFVMEGSVARDEGSEACDLDPRLTFVPSGGFYDLLLAHADAYTYTYEGYDGDYTYDYTDVLSAGYSYRFGDYDYPGPYWVRISYDGSDRGTFSRTGDDIAWAFGYSRSYDDDVANYYSDCASVDRSSATAASAGEAGTGEVDCDADLVDVWSVDVDATGSLTASVDMVATESAFDPILWVNDADACTVASADDNFTCAFSGNGICPAVELTSLAEGTYSLVVQALDSDTCDGTVAAYQLTANGGAATNLTQTHDDADEYTTESVSYDFALTASGTITPQ